MSQGLESNEPQSPCLVTVAKEAVSLACMDTCFCACVRAHTRSLGCGKGAVPVGEGYDLKMFS